MREQVAIVNEAMDLFCAAIKSFDERLHISKSIAKIWKVQESDVDILLKSNKPNIVLTCTTLHNMEKDKLKLDV